MKYWVSIFFISICTLPVQAAFFLPKQNKLEIPFEYVSGLIVLKADFNGIPLTFILDSGVGETLLFSINNNDSLLNNAEKMWFAGLGGGLSAEGLKSVHNELRFSNEFVDTNHTVYVILNNEFNLSDRLGVNVNGIIGYHFFKDHIVQIDYVRKKILIYKSIQSVHVARKHYEQLPLTIENKKAYISLGIQLKQDFIESKVLLDIGNSEAVLFFPDRILEFRFSSRVLHDYLGRGFNGNVSGTRGRIQALKLGTYVLNKPLVSVMDSLAVQNINFSNEKVGLMGSGILSRFDIIVDYPNNRLYYRPNRYFKKPFWFNMSGLTLKHEGFVWTQVKVSLVMAQMAYGMKDSLIGSRVYSAPSNFQYQFELKPSFSVEDVRLGSPGDKAGVLPGDIITEVNGVAAYKFRLQDLYNVFSSKDGQVLRLVVTRNGKKLKKKMVLIDPMPFEE